MNRLAASEHWPACAVEIRPIASLKPATRNVRVHSDLQIKQIRASLREFGWTMPVLIDEDGAIIAGHGRVEAAKREGIAQAPVAVATGWTEAQRRAYAIADNKIPLNSTWDEAGLGIELSELSGLGVDLAMLGFDDGETVPKTKDKPPADTSSKLDGLSYSIVLRCRDERHQMELLDKLEKEGLSCEALIS